MTRNLLGSYASEDEALEDIARGVCEHRGDTRTAANLMLVREEPGGPDDELVGDGEALARRAVERFPESARRSA